MYIVSFHVLVHVLVIWRITGCIYLYSCKDEHQKPGYRYHMLLNFLSNIWSLVEQSFQITTYTVVVLNLIPRVLSYSAPMARERERDRETLVSSGHVSRWQNKVPGRGLFYWTFCRSLVLTLSKQGCYYQALRLHKFAMFYSAVYTLLSSTVTTGALFSSLKK